MCKIRNVFSILVVLILAFSSSALAATQSLTILGANGVQGDVDPYTEFSTDGGNTWHQAYLTGWHPWGFLPNTNSWINLDPSPFVGLNTTTLYRVRFSAPADATNPTAQIQMKADNIADVSFNGTPVAHIVGQGSANADLAFANTLRSGMNEISITLIDQGGWVGFNYRIDLTVESASPLTIAPASSSPEGIALAKPPVEVDGGAKHQCAFNRLDGTVNCWPVPNQWNQYNVYGEGDDYIEGDAIEFSSGDYTNCVLKADGNTACWGYHGEQLSYTGGDATNMSVGYDQACVVTDAGNVNCYGRYLGGASWHEVYGGGDAEWVVNSSYAACFKTASQAPNELTCKGWNVTEPTWLTQGNPLPAAGGHYAMCIATDTGNVDCMNNNYNETGQSAGYYLGDATDGDAQFDTSCAVTSDGDVKCWGRYYGQGYPMNQPPQLIGVDAVSVSVAGYHDVCYATRTGEVNCTSSTPDIISGSNADPTADAGAAQKVESTGATTAVHLNGSASSDPDGDTLTYAWSWNGGAATGMNPTINLANGTYAISLTVDDGNGGTDVSTTTVTVQDTVAPSITIAPIPVVEANDINGTAVNVSSFITVSDVCSTSLSISPAGPFMLGDTQVTVTATDCAGNASSAGVTVSIVDSTPPVLTLSADVVAEATGSLSQVDIGTATATDIFDVTITSNAPASFPLGSTLVTWTATDANGNATSATQKVTVVDTTAPTFSVSQQTGTLWPVNHKMVLVATISQVSDVVDSTPVVSINISSNQPANSIGDGNTSSDWQVVQNGGVWEVWLRAERSAPLGDRTYSVEVTVTDQSANAASGSFSAVVPQSQGVKKGKK